MPLIDQMIESLHSLHLPQVARALQVYHAIDVPAELAEVYIHHLSKNSPLMLNALDEKGRAELRNAIDNLYRVIQVLNRCVPTFPFGRALKDMEFIGKNAEICQIQELLLDKMIEEYADPAESDNENAEIVFKNRVQIIREAILEYAGSSQ
jgi:hypothetical protein